MRNLSTHNFALDSKKDKICRVCMFSETLLLLIGVKNLYLHISRSVDNRPTVGGAVKTTEGNVSHDLNVCGWPRNKLLQTISPLHERIKFPYEISVQYFLPPSYLQNNLISRFTSA